MPKLISIIIPVYNRVEIFEKSLLSAIQQNYENKEIIVVDDGSIPAISNFKFQISNDLQIKWFRQDNAGAPSARNKGFRESKGDYLIFWDADIEAESDMLEKMA